MEYKVLTKKVDLKHEDKGDLITTNHWKELKQKKWTDWKKMQVEMKGT